MLNNIQIKAKIVFPIIVLFSIFLLLTGSLIYTEYSKNLALSNLENKIILATKLSKLLHATQNERGMSVGLISSHGMQFQKELALQRTHTDITLQEVNTFVDSTNAVEGTEEINSAFKSALKSMAQLANIRGAIDTLSISSDDIMSFYSDMNSAILKITVEITKYSQQPKITQNIIAYSGFLYLKESVGIERAIGTEILSSSNLDHSKINQFNSLIAKQDIYRDFFLAYASEDFKSDYNDNDFFKGSSVDRVKSIRGTILSADQDHIKKLDVKDWFTHITIKIDTLKNIDDHLSEHILSNIDDALSTTRKKLIIVVLLNMASVVIFTFMLIWLINLLKSEQRLKSLINKHVISSTTDLNGVITDVSDAFCDISGYTRDELLGENHNIIRHRDMPKKVFETLWNTIKSGKTWQGEIKNRHKDGSYYWVAAIVSPLYDHHKKIGYSAIRHDITDKKKLEDVNSTLESIISYEVEQNRLKDQQMLQQSRLAQMGEMISMIAHQWRQPLAAISSTSSAISLKATLHKLDEETAVELSKKISEYSEHLSTTIDDFRNFFHSNKKKSQTTYTELVESVLNIIEVSIANHNIELITELDCSDTLETYPNELKQVILNLIKNAEDVLLEKEINAPYIKIKTYKQDNTLILQVSDNGGGIEEDNIDKIFDPYFSTKMERNGTGLGLYMSKTIVEDHCGGKLSVSNNKDGAVFTIALSDNHK